MITHGIIFEIVGTNLQAYGPHRPDVTMRRTPATFPQKHRFPAQIAFRYSVDHRPDCMTRLFRIGINQQPHLCPLNEQFCSGSAAIGPSASPAVIPFGNRDATTRLVEVEKA